MSESENVVAWARLHKNGRVAMVYEWRDDGETYFSAGAVPATGCGAIAGNVLGPLAEVQTYADRESGCPQPCNCAPWTP